MSDYYQRAYFDQKNHRFDQHLLKSPPLFQQLELDQLFQALNISPKSQLIDFGAGSGRVSIFFLKLGFNVLAVDVSRQSLSDLSTYYRQHRQPTWGSLTISSNLPYRQTADGIIGADVLHHISLTEYLPLFMKCLRPGGRIAFSEPNAWHLPWYFHYWVNKIPWSIEKGILQCTLPNLNSSFQTAGFNNVQITGHGLLPTRFFSGHSSVCRFNIQIGRYFSPLAFRFIISAQAYSP